MPPPFPADLPPHEAYADFLDADDWNPVMHGRFADFATSDDDVLTEPDDDTAPDAASS